MYNFIIISGLKAYAVKDSVRVRGTEDRLVLGRKLLLGLLRTKVEKEVVLAVGLGDIARIDDPFE